MCLPLLMTRIMSGKESVIINKQMDLEKVLPLIMCQNIPGDYEDEMLKAQAVLERSSLYYLAANGEKNVGDKYLDTYYELSQKRNFQRIYEKMEQAVKETKGKVLRYDGKICRGIYHKVSAGQTRDGEDIFPSSSLKYLQSVESEMDLSYESATKGFYFTVDAWNQRMKEKYPEIIFEKNSLSEELYIVDRDSSGYVMEVQVGNVTLPGEEFRKMLDLSSSNFEIQFIDGSIRFLCSGVGHGFGLSQYGGNELAKQGNTYMEILEHYFPGAEIY